MVLIKATKDQIENIVNISKRAFISDINVGASMEDGPPDYDSVAWHDQMAKEGHLFQAMVDNTLVGGAVVFLNEKQKHLYIGRIFIDDIYHRKGYGMDLMDCVEN